MKISKKSRIQRVVWVALTLMFLVALFPNSYFQSSGKATNLRLHRSFGTDSDRRYTRQVSKGHQFIFTIYNNQIDYKRVFFYWLLIALPSGGIILAVNQKKDEDNSK